MGNPLQSYGASPAVWDHTCYPTQVNVRRLHFSLTGRYWINLPRRA